MCEIRLEDSEPVGFWNERDVKRARKSHDCDSCDGQILPGEPYRWVSYSWDGGVYTEKQCAGCREDYVEFCKEHRTSIPWPELRAYLNECIDQEPDTSERWRLALARMDARRKK